MIEIWEVSIPTPARIEQRHYIGKMDALKDAYRWIGDMRNVKTVLVEEVQGTFVPTVKIYGLADMNDKKEDALHVAFLRPVTLYESSDFEWNADYGKPTVGYYTKKEEA